MNKRKIVKVCLYSDMVTGWGSRKIVDKSHSKRKRGVLSLPIPTSKIYTIVLIIVSKTPTRSRNEIQEVHETRKRMLV